MAWDVAPAKMKAKTSTGWSLLALAFSWPNWLLALDRQAPAAINLGVSITAKQHAWGTWDFTFKSTVEGLQVLRDLGKRQDLTSMLPLATRNFTD